MDKTLDTPVEPMAVSETPQIEFTGRRGALFFLVLKNILLNIITLGIFRFWGKTRVRRYFWGNIVIGGEPLEYVGRGMEMFIGFLIVVAVLVPLSLAVSGVRYLVGVETGWTGAVIDGLYFVVFWFLVQFALFRMWRYRLTRTVWRGVRFGLDGDAFPYAIRAFGWWIARVLTLGIIHPWANVDLMRYKLQRMRFGSTNFEFEGNGKALIVPWLIAWVVPGALLICGFISAQLLAFQMTEQMSQGVQVMPNFTTWGIVGLVVLPLGGISFFFTFIWYRIREFRYFAGCLGFRDAAIRSGAEAKNAILPILFAGGIFLFVFGLIFTIFAGVAGIAKASGVLANGWEGFIPLLVPLIAILFMPVLTYPVVVFTIVRHLWTTLAITNPQAFEEAAQSAEVAPQFGEGLADAFDVGAI